jgi:hypothetical protein
MRGGGGLPHEGDFFGGESVGLVDEVGELAFELQGFDGLGASRHDGADVLVAEALDGRASTGTADMMRGLRKLWTSWGRV